MQSRFKVQLFGKQGCKKCKVLNGRLDKILEQDQWQDFDKEYMDLDTEEGLVALCEAECINPQQIPALLVTRVGENNEEFHPLPRKKPGEEAPACGKSHLYQYVGLQTDYSDDGKGVVTPNMIEEVLTEALS